MGLRRLLPFLTGAIVFTLFDSDRAYAWGPATHVSLALEVVDRLGWLPATVAVVIGRHVTDFLYGNLAADLVFAKRLSRVKQFCHHWSTGFSVLDQAKDDRGRSFGYGYLCHLAADTVAHGQYVPRQIAACDTTINFGHFYWEMRADVLGDTVSWERLAETLRGDFEDHHRTLACLLTQTLLPFEYNRRLFLHMNRLVSRERWRKTVLMWDRRSRFDLNAKLVARYRTESLDRMINVLRLQERSPVLLEDPNGTVALEFMRQNRRWVRRLRRAGHPTGRCKEEVCASFAPNTVRAGLRPPLTQPTGVLEAVS